MRLVAKPIAPEVRLSRTKQSSKTGKDCLLTPPLYYQDKLPIAEELFKIYFIHIRAIRKDATYGTLPSRKQQLQLFKDSIRDGLLYLYNAAVLENNLQGLLLRWNELVTKEG